MPPNTIETGDLEESKETSKQKKSKSQQALPGVFAGFTRSIAASTTIFTLGVLKETVLWWFRFPIKMFRPYAIDPYFVIHEIAKKDGSPLTVQYLRSMLKREGFGLIKLNVLPLMLANGVVGTVLFQSYTFTEKLISSKEALFGSHFIAGGVAGSVQTLLSTPMDQLSMTIRKGDALKFKSKGIYHALSTSWALLPTGSKLRLQYLYRGLNYNILRDSMGFAMFFGVFTSTQTIGKKYNAGLWNQEFDENQQIFSRERPTGLKVADGLTVVAAGAMAGAGYQLVCYPIDKLRIKLHIMQQEAMIPRANLESGLNLVLQHGIMSFYKGIGQQLFRVMPPSALGLFVYEISSDWIKEL